MGFHWRWLQTSTALFWFLLDRCFQWLDPHSRCLAHPQEAVRPESWSSLVNPGGTWFQHSPETSALQHSTLPGAWATRGRVAAGSTLWQLLIDCLYPSQLWNEPEPEPFTCKFHCILAQWLYHICKIRARMRNIEDLRRALAACGRGKRAGSWKRWVYAGSYRVSCKFEELTKVYLGKRWPLSLISCFQPLG